MHDHAMFFSKHLLHESRFAIKPGFAQLFIVRALSSSRFLTKYVR
jgi:hypothetical protein